MKTDFDLILEKVGSTEELIENISELSSDSETILTTYVNPYSVQLLRRNVIHKLSNIYVDGITLVWLLKFAYGFKIRRASFDLTSHAEELFSFCETTSYKFGMIGGTESEIESSVKFFSNRYPGLKINFFCSGYLDETNNQNLFNNLEGCDFIICGMGTPKQEEFMNHKQIVHGKDTQYDCKECDKEFSNMEDMRTHLQRKHSYKKDR